MFRWAHPVPMPLFFVHVHSCHDTVNFWIEWFKIREIENWIYQANFTLKTFFVKLCFNFYESRKMESNSHLILWKFLALWQIFFVWVYCKIQKLETLLSVKTNSLLNETLDRNVILKRHWAKRAWYLYICQCQWRGFHIEFKFYLNDCFVKPL